jgi:hypothetical protein
MVGGATPGAFFVTIRLEHPLNLLDNVIQKEGFGFIRSTF